MNGIKIQGDLSETKEIDSNLKSDLILYIDNTKDNDLIQFITKAQQQGCNCLDLSKRNINEFPSQLLEFTSLQYLYLEGNKLTQLPNDLFFRLSHLKWLDLRNNQLTSIPSQGLAKHRCLQYLLLSENHLRTLPFELGKVKTLSALNLDRNPLDYPPIEIIRQGIKSIQQYLRDKLNSDGELSSDNDQQQEQTPRFPYQQSITFPLKSKSELGYYETTQSNFLPPHLQSCIQYKRINCSATRPSSLIKFRPQSEMKIPQVKTKTTMQKNNNQETNVYTVREHTLMHLKHRSIKLDEQLEHHYIEMMNKDQQNLIQYDNQQNHLTDEDEERRIHDRQIQDRIRQITNTMLKRRLQVQSNPSEEKRQIKLELLELRKLESDDGKKHHFKSHKKF